MTGLVGTSLRILALIGKELVEVARRPGAVVSLVLGPFLILAIFGIGYQGVKRDLSTVVVVRPGSGLPTDVAGYADFETRGVRVVGVTQDRAEAEARLRHGEVDLVVIAPEHPRQDFEAGRQSELLVESNLVDPVEANYAAFMADTLAAQVNRELYRKGAQQGEDYGLTVGGKALSQVPPDVIASPMRATTVNVAPVAPSIVSFFGVAALALVLQHMAVTLLALSIVRDRQSGAMDLFRTSPIRATEVVLGKVIAFGTLGALIAAVSIGLLVGVLGVPMLAPTAWVAGVIGLVLLASLGLGLLISVVSDSERQAVQLSLLALLASMFFSGFVLRIDEFDPVVHAGAYLLPVTHGIRLLQDLMLRGGTNEAWEVLALAAIAAVLLVVSWLLLRREMRPA